MPRSLDQLTHQNTGGAGASGAPVSRYDQPTTRAAKMNLEPLCAKRLAMSRKRVENTLKTNANMEGNQSKTPM